MLLIQYPIPCDECGKSMENYYIDKTTNKIVFKCGCGYAAALTEAEYIKRLKKSNPTLD